MVVNSRTIRAYLIVFARQILEVLAYESNEEANDYLQASDNRLVQEIDIEQFIIHFWTVDILERLNVLEQFVHSPSQIASSLNLESMLKHSDVVGLGLDVYSSLLNSSIFSAMNIEVDIQALLDNIHRFHVVRMRIIFHLL